ncbi:chitobiosyldiphosphodolichol beta-mannosyltransferase [Sitophilus oryzae]|uniref:Beta-1,4-mannosyltransferase n=1 Tax=Sitophilus oryzae TaxID=7048 RepID=A0A6J2XSA6_SITOR|nr:chitobiosyldiphosphodolichol beta-mannosyltransferase [Sitophilus oryzae]
MEDKKKNVCIVVLGDIGRSPRMQYHSLSLAEKGHKVDIIGYGETEPLHEIKMSPSIYYHFLCPVPYIPIRSVNYIFKTIFQALNLLFLLFTIRSPSVLMVQNPPAIPSLVVCWLFCRVKRAKFIIDWHNYAHTIMALNVQSDKKNKFVKWTEKCEAFAGARADHNFCVTNEMKNDLLTRWNIKSQTLYDKPPEIFRPITLKEKHNFLLKLGQIYKTILNETNSTVFTELSGTDIVLKENRPGLLVSSTSWTEDEDFSILFSALQDYENHIRNGNVRKLPNLICFITGKGYLKQYYTKIIAKENWEHIKVITPWLDSSDYPLILASADLGICLHTSSSGLDLPMKVVDMFGCCLPVLAYDFKCLHELVADGKNSYTFKTSEDLSSKLLSWFDNFPNNKNQQEIDVKFKAELKTFQSLRWKENWNNVACPAFQ